MIYRKSNWRINGVRWRNDREKMGGEIVTNHNSGRQSRLFLNYYIVVRVECLDKKTR